ncbi:MULTISPECIES: GNAT family N-acetyltransferase [Okeania]|uniref:GNAT family N-acetyltransferase n=3 Tax=Okeania TaxID=1458928 RepID=A0A3N6PKY2_9CYAN|nr:MULTISPECIES: GNAT family N-acetyltransferase [Okeania]NET77761.1 GNAT family N-acetyltransferase [Okeania sp. SIO1F9]RQH22517.1 GNAT family N-acetyltransferase [Okeania hirsuta]RQH42367.1 GNAT family N-acetyltransferase [Okeania hirsuta]
MKPLTRQNKSQVVIRPLEYRDLEAIKNLCRETPEVQHNHRDVTFNLSPISLSQKLPQISRWYWPIKLLSLFPNPCKYLLISYVAEVDGQIKGAIQVSPSNRTRSSWRVEGIVTEETGTNRGIGSQLLRYCFEKIWEARTWLLEVNVNDKETMALYRQNGFQPLAQITYWTITPQQLQELALSQPNLPNLLPVSNADAQLLYQLDTASMPPLVRQVFDRHIPDFKTGFVSSLIEGVRQWLNHNELVSGYVFEPQRKAAIGYFQVQLCRDGTQPHIAQLTVHPAYTWLYPELLSQMATLAQDFPDQSLQLASVDYQPEREAYLEKIKAQQIEHSLLMSRSVWHKLRESKSVISDLQFSEVLQGLQPVRKPVPSRSSLLKMMQNKHGKSNNSQLKTNHNNYYWEATNEQVNSPSPTISPNLTSGEEDDNGKSQK